MLTHYIGASFVHKFSPWLRKHLSRKCNFPSFSPTSLWHLHCWTRLDRNWEQKYNFPFQFLMPQTPWRWVGQGHWKCKSWMKVTTMRSQEDSASCSLQEKPQNCLHKSQRYGWPYSSLLRLTSIFTSQKQNISHLLSTCNILTHTHTQHATQLVNTSNTFAPTMNWVYHLIYSSARENTRHIQWIHKFMSHFWRWVSIYIMALDTDVSWWIDCEALCVDNHGLPVSI